MKVNIVKAKVGEQKVNCRLEPGFLGPSMYINCRKAKLQLN
jgi:hypothetical protein